MSKARGEALDQPENLHKAPFTPKANAIKKIYIQEIEYIKDFLAQNRFLFWFVALATIITFGIKIFWLDYSIDTEIGIDNYNHIQHLWIGLDRLGLVLIKKVLFPSLLNPFLENILTYITLFITVISLCYLIARISAPKHIKPAYLFAFALIFFSSPVIAEQLNFVSQSFEVCLGMFLTIISIYSLYLAFQHKVYLLILPSVILSVFAASIYQSLIPFYICCFATTLVFYSLPTNPQFSAKRFWRYTLLGTGAFLCSMLLFYLLPYLYYVLTGSKEALHSSYLSSQVGWGRLSLGQVLHNIKTASEAILFGRGYFYSHALLVGIFFAGVTAGILYRSRSVSRIICSLLALVVLIATPFLLILAIGGEAALRTNMPSLQLATAVLYLYCLLVWERQVIRGVILVTALGFAYMQVVTTANVLYLEHMKYEEDIALTTRFASRLDSLGFNDYRDYHLVVIGVHEPRIPGEVKSEAVLDNSFYEWDTNTFTGVSNRVAGFMISQGYPFELFDATDSSDKAVAKRVFLEYLNLPLWPQRGSVIIDQSDKVVVLRIGES